MAAISARSQGAGVGPSPVDRARPGSKHHLIVDATGIPLAITLTGANRNDVTQLLPLVDTIGPVRGKVGRPRQHTDTLIADRGYDHDKYRRALWQRGITPAIARRQTSTDPALDAALGRRAHLRLATPTAAPAHPLGTRPTPAPRVQ
jgi:transposase